MPNKQDDDYLFIKNLKQAKKYRSKPTLIKHCWKFEDKIDFVRWIINPKINKGNPLPDYIAFYGVPFTMEEYDWGGQYVKYANRKLGIQIEVNHVNRYKDMASITDICMYEACDWRNDITYLD